MPNYRKQRIERKRLRFSAMGKASQRVQAEARMERAREAAAIQAEYDVLNYPRQTGDALGCLQWTDYRTGRVRKLIVRIGDRSDRITLESPDGRKTGSHGWSWALVKLRKMILNHA